jgi:hypothetical protein
MLKRHPLSLRHEGNKEHDESYIHRPVEQECIPGPKPWTRVGSFAFYLTGIGKEKINFAPRDGGW